MFLREKKTIIAYTPALDLSTSGKTVAQAQKRFAEIVKIFLNDLVERNVLEPVLLSLGWTKGESKSKWTAPQTVLSQKQMRVTVGA